MQRSNSTMLQVGNASVRIEHLAGIRTCERECDSVDREVAAGRDQLQWVPESRLAGLRKPDIALHEFAPDRLMFRQAVSRWRSRIARESSDFRSRAIAIAS